MKEIILTWLKHTLSNPHTSFAAVVCFSGEVIAIMWPEYKAKTDAIIRLAIVYGFLNSRDTTRDRKVDALLAESVKREEEAQANAQASDPVKRILPPQA